MGKGHSHLSVTKNVVSLPLKNQDRTGENIRKKLIRLAFPPRCHNEEKNFIYELRLPFPRIL